MKINTTEKKMLNKRLAKLRNYMAFCLKKNKLDDYFNTANSRELALLENLMVSQGLPYEESICLQKAC